MKHLIFIAAISLLVGCSMEASVGSSPNSEQKKLKPKPSIFKNLGKAPGPVRNKVVYFTHNGNDCYLVNHWEGTSISCLKQ